MTRETVRIHPRTDGKGAAAIENANRTRIDGVIDRRRERARVLDGWRRLALRVVLLALAVWLILTFAFTFAVVHGQGMFPALKDGDLCIVFRTGLQRTLGNGFQKDDVVVCRVNGERVIGRVAAVAGDRVEISTEGGLTVNGVSQSGEIMFQTYARGDSDTPFTVPEGSLYILGDHRTDVRDSRDFGPIPLESVEGKVISILRRRGL